jgi:hypothetical protein
MYKQHLINSIEKEIKICKRLYTKIPADKMDFRLKEGVRSVSELLQYLGMIGRAMLTFWLKHDPSEFNTFFNEKTIKAGSMLHGDFLAVMDEQLGAVKNLFNEIKEEDLYKEVTYPWGGKTELGEGIMATSIKWLAAYKLQLFSLIKLSIDDSLSTADAWVLTDPD